MPSTQALLEYQVSRTGPVTLTQVAGALAAVDIFAGNFQAALLTLGITLFADITDTTATTGRRRILFALDNTFDTNFPGASAVAFFTGMFLQQISMAMKAPVVESTPLVQDFNPTMAGAAWAWMRADRLVTEVGGVVTALGNNVPVSPPANVVQAVPGVQPTRLAVDPAYGGQSTLVYVGAQRLESIAFAAHPQPTAIFAVGNVTNLGGRLISGAAAAQQSLVSGGAVEWALDAGGVPIVAVGSGSAAPSAIFANINGGASDLYVDDFTTPAISGNPGPNGIDQLAIGAIVGGGGGSEMVGKFADVCLYDGTIDQMNRARLRLYTQQRYLL